MDLKDVFDTLGSIGITGLFVALSLWYENRKKRKRLNRIRQSNVSQPHSPAPKAKPQPWSRRAGQPRPAEVVPAPPKASTYSFRPEDEGGCTVSHDNMAEAAAHDELSQPKSEIAAEINTDDRRKLLKTLILGEVLARKY